jgi:carbon-monoxide dehydrogenase medium subunit
MIPASFNYVRASSLAHAIDLAQDNPDVSKFVAGGHTLLPTLKLRLASPELLIDIRNLAELRGIEVSDSSIKIGASVTHAELLSFVPLFRTMPIFRQAAQVVADPQVRNRGTIGGSLANADPAADWPAVVIALNAEIEMAGPAGSRRVKAKDFFVDIFTTALEPGEVLTAIHIARPEAAMRFGYRKIRHPASGYAVVGVAAGLLLSGGVTRRVALGITGAASHAFAGDAAIDMLEGKPMSRELVEAAAQSVSESIVCLSDRYAPAEYRAALVRTEVARALFALSS